MLSYLNFGFVRRCIRVISLGGRHRLTDLWHPEGIHVLSTVEEAGLIECSLV
jgi:hypothetical protein